MDKEADDPISRVRTRDLARPGRYRPDAGREAAWRRACASLRESGTEASGIAAALPSRPGAASSRSGDGDLVIISLLAHGGVPGAIAEGAIAIAVVGVLVAVWLRERRDGEERDRVSDERRDRE